MKNAKIEDFYVDSECTELKKSFSMDRSSLDIKDFDLDGWTFVGFKQAVETNIPSNRKYDTEPEIYYVLDFYPIGVKTYAACDNFDHDVKSDCRFSTGKRIYQVRVSEEFLRNFIDNGLYRHQSLKTVITDVIENDKY
ncbi:MAG: hypothetical protein K2K31_03105, partial [Clostridia bacterium]|nr:hypothetical protein [Clostridia bacterium]